jgi:hypothetical protein
MTVIVREEHRELFVRMARARRLWVGHPLPHPTDAEQADGENPDEVIESGPVAARLHVSAAARRAGWCARSTLGWPGGTCRW